MHNMTSALLVLCSEFSATGLKQFMFNPSQLLSLDEILTASELQRDDIAHQISTYFITTTVQILHPEAVNFIFNDTDNQFPQMPQLKLLTSRRTTMQQLRVIFHDEDTIDETYDVHQNIWIQKLDFKKNDESHHFDECLWLAWDDQKIVSLIWTLKAEQSIATQAFDQRNWLLESSVFFHVLQAFLYLIVWIHFESSSETHSKFTLFHDIGYWDWHEIIWENVKYHLLKLLIMQDWTAQVLAIWYDILHFNNCFQSIWEINKDWHEAYDAAIKQLSSTQFLQYVEEVHQQDFIYTSWTDHWQADKKFVTMCQYF